MINFHDWLKVARPGDSFTYYIGNLAAARGDVSAFPRRAENAPELIEAQRAWDAYVAGLVSLVQRANTPCRPNGTHPSFNYIAQRTRRSAGG